MNRILITGLLVVLLLPSCFRMEEPEIGNEPGQSQDKHDALESITKGPLQCADTTVNQHNVEKRWSFDSLINKQIIHEQNVGKLSTKSLAEIQLAGYDSSVDHKPDSVVLSNPYTESFTSLNRYFMIHFENDIFAERDQYYTNGIAFKWIHPYFKHLPITRTLPGLGKRSVNQYGLHLRQMMFTPIHPETNVIVANDRPFAGVLYLGFFRISVLNERKLQLISEIQLGTIGPRSLAESLQRGIHEKEPNGWAFQIQNDLLVNFNFSIEKTAFATRTFDAGFLAGLKAGSLHSNISGGVFFRYGSYVPYSNTMGTATSFHIDPALNKRMQYGFFGRFSGLLIGYDATLNGGLFNKSSPHRFELDQLHRRVLEAELGGVFVYEQYGLQFSYAYLSPEFMEGREHFWGNIKLFYIY